MKQVLPVILFFLYIIFLPESRAFGQDSLYTPVGNVTGYSKTATGITIRTTHGVALLDVYSPNIIRVRVGRTAEALSTSHNYSYAVVAEPDSKAHYTLTETEDALTLQTDSFRLVARKKPLRLQCFTSSGTLINEDSPTLGSGWQGEAVSTYKTLQPNERFIGLGEKTGPLDRRGNAYVNWNTDFFGYPTGADPIYATLPFYIGINGQQVYGIFFDNSYKSNFNFGASNDRFSSFGADAGQMNYYFINGSSVAGIIQGYSHLTGTLALPPKWSIGYHQCHYSYFPDKEVLNIARTFREKNIPADAITLDIHYMDAYKIFTWNNERFPDPKGMLNTLKSSGFHTTVIVDPGIKVEKGYSAYESGLAGNHFLHYPDHSFYIGAVWPGWCHFPDFTIASAREWWGKNFKGYVDTGVEGFWNDMNEPASWGNSFPSLVQFGYEGDTSTTRRCRNLYGLEMARATYEGTRKLLGGSRPFVLTRAAYSGVQRYSAIWTGDNLSTDEHMLAGVRLVNSLGLAGMPFAGVDIGGFAGGCSKELFSRWIALGAFTPFCRTHSAIENKASEPWSYGERVEQVARNYINLRYRLLPYLYSTFYEASQTGMPIARSLAVNYTFDPHIYQGNYQNQYLFGPWLLVAPLESSRDIADVYLPAGGWYELENDTYHPDAGRLYAPAPPEHLPVFVKAGAILPEQTLVQYTDQKPGDTLIVHLYAAKTGSSYTYYEDDGQTYRFEQGEYYRRTFTLDPTHHSLKLGKAEGSYGSQFKYIQVVLHGSWPLKAEATLDGKPAKWASAGVEFIPALTNFSPDANTPHPGKGAMAQHPALTFSNTPEAHELLW